MNNRRGRPKKSPADIVRGLLWFRIIQTIFRGAKPYSIEKFFSPEKFRKDADRATIRPCQWDKYASGRCLPRKKTVEGIGYHFRETKYWFDHPIWRLLNPSRISEEEIKAILTENHPSLIKQEDPRIRYPSTRTLDALEKRDDIKSLTALLALARYFKDSGHYSSTAEMLKRMALKLDQTIENSYLSLVKNEFFDLLINLFSEKKIFKTQINRAKYKTITTFRPLKKLAFNEILVELRFPPRIHNREPERKPAFDRKTDEIARKYFEERSKIKNALKEIPIPKEVSALKKQYNQLN